MVWPWVFLWVLFLWLAMGPTLAKAFIVYNEKNWIEHSPLEYGPFYYQGMLMIYLFYIIHKNISNVFRVT